MTDLRQRTESGPVFIGWPTEGVMYWNAFWRGPAGAELLSEIEPESEDTQ